MWKRFKKWLNSYNYSIYLFYENGTQTAYVAVRESWYLGVRDEKFRNTYEEAIAEINTWKKPKNEYSYVFFEQL